MIYPGTTPTHSFALPFETDTLAEAWVSYAQSGNVIITRRLDELKRSGKTLTAELTQEETLRLEDKLPVEIQIRCRTTGGQALTSEPIGVRSGSILKRGVI